MARAVIETRGCGVRPYEQLTWYYAVVSSASEACETMVDENVVDLPSQQDTGGATGPSQEEQGPSYGVRARPTATTPAMRGPLPHTAPPHSARRRPYQRSRQ